MKSLKGVICGTVLGLSLTAASAWAQGQPQQDQPQPDQAQQAPDQQPPSDAQVAQPPAAKPSPDVATPQAQSPEAQPSQSQAPPPPPGQSANQSGPVVDAPSRVARLQYTAGSVSIQPQGTGDWVTGAINRPLTNSDNVWADTDSRAELNVGDGILRIGSESSLTLTNVGDNAVQVELHQGTLNLRVRSLQSGEVFEVDTPNMAFTVQKTGEYRFDVDPNGDASIATVWKGEGEATGNGPSVRVQAHERARFTDGNSLKHDISPAPAYDGFDDWARVRDDREDHSTSTQYVAPGTIGSEDLDEYGSWRNEDPYGQVWVPSGVAAGWSPYSDGHWVWIAPWGWTWVDNAPWGFAPFHYGRWVYGGGYWGWAPGPYYGRPYYAPALVSWFGGPGFGGGFGFGFGGGIGWCPLGFGEPFFPWYRGSWGYFSRVNFYNTRIGNIDRFRGFYRGGTFAGTSFRYANLRAPGGAIAVPQRTLTGSLSVRGTAVRVPASQFERASLGGRVGVSPTRESRLGGNTSRATAAPPSRSFARPVVSANARAGAFGNRTASPSAGRFGGSAAASGHFVPRPPQSNGGAMGARGNSSAMSGGRSYSSPSSQMSHNNVPRPPSGSRSGYGQGNGGYSRPSAPRSTQDSGHGRNFTSVPRPDGASRGESYSSNSYGGRSYSSESRGYAGSNRSYGASRSYGSGYSQSPSYRSYSAPAQRSYSEPSSRGYSAPSYRSYSAPAQRSYSAPSSRGSSSSYRGSSGSGSRSSGGGGHSGHR